MKVDYKNDIESVLLSEEKLKEIVTSLGKQISDDYRDSVPTIRKKLCRRRWTMPATTSVS